MRHRSHRSQMLALSLVSLAVLAACGGGGSASNTTPPAAASPAAVIQDGNTALGSLAKSLSTPTASAAVALPDGTAPLFAMLYKWLPLSQAQADVVTDANGCTTGGGVGTLADGNHFATKDVFCHLTATDSTARDAVPKVLDTMTGLVKALETANALKYDAVDRPGTYNLAFGSNTYTVNFDKIIGTAPAKFDGTTHTGFDYGIEFNTTGATSQYWRIAVAKTSSGFKIKWAVNSAANTESNPAGEGYEAGYLEVLTSGGQRTVRLLQTIHPNAAATTGGGARVQQLFGQQTASDTSAYYSTLSYARLTQPLPLGGSARLTLSQNVQGKQLLKAQAYEKAGGSWTARDAEALCAKTVSSTPAACTEVIATDSSQFAGYVNTYADDASAWNAMKTRFDAYTSGFSSWDRVPGITGAVAQ